MYQYCSTNWRRVAQSRTGHPGITINPWHLRAPAVTPVYGITFITLSSKKPWDPCIFMSVTEPNLAVRGIYPGHSSVISTSLILSRSLITPGTTALPCLKKKKKKIPGTWGWRLESHKYSYFPSSSPGRRNFWLEYLPILESHTITSILKKKSKHVFTDSRPDLPHEFWVAERHPAILRSLASSWPSLPSSCLSSAFETAFRAPP